MSDGTYAHRLGLMVSLVAPVGAMCEEVALHVRDAIAALEEGGITAGEWLNIICPHGMTGGSVYVTWRECGERGVRAQWRFGPDGVVNLCHVSMGTGPEWFEGYGSALDSTYAAVSMVGTFGTPYSVGDAVAWLIAHELGEGHRLPRAGSPAGRAGEGSEPPGMVPGGDLLGCLSGVDPERN